MSEVIVSDLTVNSVWVCRQHRNRQLKTGWLFHLNVSHVVTQAVYCLNNIQQYLSFFCSGLAIKDIALVQ